MLFKTANIKLNNGLRIPAFGLSLSENNVEGDTSLSRIVEEAIDFGYRLFKCDSSACEKQLGEAIQKKISEGIVQRDDLFIICTFPQIDHVSVEVAATSSLKNLQLTFMDMYLISSGSDYVNSWKGMESVYRQKFTKAVGVSNFRSKQIDTILNVCSVFPQVNQVVYGSLFERRDLRKYCESNGIAVVGENIIGLDEGISGIVEIADRYEKTPAQVVLKYQLQLGNVVLVRIQQLHTLKMFSEAFDFWLAPEDMSYINSFSD